jgi:four helix bundle protein
MAARGGQAVLVQCGIQNAEWGMKGGEDRMRGDDLRKRTKSFALRVIHLVEALPKGKTSDVIGRQLLRSGTSVGANYRASCRAKSAADFISKMGTVEEETDECIYWMELLIESGLMPQNIVYELQHEAEELLAIIVSSIKTTKKAVNS